MPPLHIKLGIVKNCIKAIVKQPKNLDCLKNIFPRISEAKLKEGVLNGPDIRKLMKSKEFKDALDGNDYLVWRAVKKVIRYFLGSKRAHNYPALGLLPENWSEHVSQNSLLASPSRLLQQAASARVG